MRSAAKYAPAKLRGTPRAYHAVRPGNGAGPARRGSGGQGGGRRVVDCLYRRMQGRPRIRFPSLSALSEPSRR